MNPNLYQILIWVGLFAVMYFILIRPQNKKDKEIKEMRANIAVGDQIVTIGGIYGKVLRVKDETFIIQIGSDKVKMEIAKWAVNNVVTEAPGKEKAKEEEKKASPKTMKKLGEKAPEAAETPAEAPAEEAAPVEAPAEEA